MSAYNHEKFVEQAILSIMNQTYQDFELLVIDDGSSDRTPEILERLSKEYGFYFERQENMGLVPTLNKLVGMAKGEYITGCASDDFWPPDRLAEQVGVLDANPAIGIVHGLPLYVDANGLPLAEKATPIVRLATGPNAYWHLLRGKKDYYTGTIMARNSTYNMIGAYDESIKVEDLDWILRAAKYSKVLACNKHWHCYRQHGANWTATASGIQKIIESEIKVIRKQGLLYGVVLWYGRIPTWFWFRRRAKCKSQYLYLLLLPLFLFNKMYLYQFLCTCFGDKVAKHLLKRLKHKAE